MSTLFMILFLTGALFAIVSFALGNIFDFGDFGIDGELPIFSVLPITPINIAIFITTLGGVGLIQISKGRGELKSFIIAFIFALIITTIVHLIVIRPLKRAENTSSASQYDFIGVEATVTQKIRENGYGEITYVKNGDTISSPAKSHDGSEIKSREKVVIVEIKDNVFIVDRFEF